MEKQPKNLEIGDQEFKRVGEMKSEDTELEHAPKSFELYQDQDGALMGKLPENHPVEELRKENINKAIIEQKIENLDIDLIKLTPKEIQELLKPGVKIYGKSKVGTDPRHEPSDEYEGDFKVVDERIYVPGQGSVYYIPSLSGHEFKKPECKILKNKIILDSSHIYDSNLSRADDHLEFSFYEIPDGYKELMEKKEGKAE